jgi:hypothetical protein
VVIAVVLVICMTFIKAAIKRRDKPLPHLFEVVLNDAQHTPAKKRALDNLGFKLVTSFLNGNSNNHCFVYHLVLEKKFE